MSITLDHKLFAFCLHYLHTCVKQADKLTVVVCIDQHLQHAGAATHHVEVNHVNSPAGCGFANIIEVHLGGIFQRSDDQLHIRKVIQKVEPCDNVHERENEKNGTNKPDGTLEETTGPRDTLVAVLVDETLRPCDRGCKRSVQRIHNIVQLDRNLTSRVFGFILAMDFIEQEQANVES